jgi:hypothetical protein
MSDSTHPSANDQSHQRQELLSEIKSYAEQLTIGLSQWHAWINAQEQTYHRGAFAELTETHAVGSKLTTRLEILHGIREGLLSKAKSLGLPSATLTHVVRGGFPAEVQLRKQLAELTIQSASVQQRNLVMWFTAYRAVEHATRVRQIIATGDSQSATYSPTETEQLEGGRLIDHAA